MRDLWAGRGLIYVLGMLETFSLKYLTPKIFFDKNKK